jgi:hypothetical protein
MPVPTPTADDPTVDRATDEQLIFAHKLERREMLRYRGLALSFLPTRPHISRLMAALGVECEQRSLALDELAKRLEIRDYQPTPLPRRLWLPKTNVHLFIVNEILAHQALDYALSAAHHSRQISALLAQFSRMDNLKALLQHFVEQKRQECRLLEEAKENASPFSEWALSG